MERVNLNLPAEARAKMRALAKERGVTEAEYAREIVLAGISRAELELVATKVRLSRTPARRALDRQTIEALEKLRG
jgi:hypothetical protein